jgi:aspartate/methionine/tyrosine aminotransferase
MNDAISKRKDTGPVRKISSRAATMPRSAIREIMALAGSRPNVVHLEVGEPDTSTPKHIVDLAFKAARSGWTKYSSNAGIPSLREIIAQRASLAWQKDVRPDRVVITTGAIGALYSALMSILDPGDELIIPDPGWPNYEAIAHLAGAIPVRFALPAKNGFLPDISEIASLITDRTKAIIINSPANPTGAVYPRSLVEKIADIASRTGVYIVSDEVYENILFDGVHVSAGSLCPNDRVFVISGFSKTYAMTGWRLGWLISPPATSSVAIGLQEPVTSCASTISQKAGEAALVGDQRCVAEARSTFLRRRDILIEVFGNSRLLPVIPSGAFYALIDISPTGLRSLEFAKRLLMTHDTAVVPGITFGPSCDDFVRVAFTTDDDSLRKGLIRLRSFIETSNNCGPAIRSSN